MDLSLSHSQQAIPPQSDPPQSETTLPTTSAPSDSSRTLRSSTRAKAPKQKLTQDTNIPDQTTSAHPEPSSRQTRSNHQTNSPKRTRDTKGKAKLQDTTEDQSTSRSTKKYVLSLARPTSLFHSQTPQSSPYHLSRHCPRSYHKRTHP